MTIPAEKVTPYSDHSDAEKASSSSHVDDGPSPRAIDDDEEYTPEEQRKIIHRIDRRLIATTGIMYCISLMDRTNLSAAAIAGMRTDLTLTGTRYVRAPFHARSTLR